MLLTRTLKEDVQEAQRLVSSGMKHERRKVGPDGLDHEQRRRKRHGAVWSPLERVASLVEAQSTRAAAVAAVGKLNDRRPVLSPRSGGGRQWWGMAKRPQA